MRKGRLFLPVLVFGVWLCCAFGVAFAFGAGFGLGFGFALGFGAAFFAAGLALKAEAGASRWCLTDASTARRARPADTGLSRIVVGNSLMNLDNARNEFFVYSVLL